MVSKGLLGRQTGPYLVHYLDRSLQQSLSIDSGSLVRVIPHYCLMDPLFKYRMTSDTES